MTILNVEEETSNVHTDTMTLVIFTLFYEMTIEYIRI